MRTKDEIVKEIKGFGFPEHEVAITVDDFFENEYYSEGCIGANIYPDPPSPEKFYLILKDLISSKKIINVFVRICDINDPLDWFYSDTIYIVTNMTIEELKESIAILQPNEIYEHWMYGKPVNIKHVENGYKIYSVWWD